jgi:exopolysaccharide biosynthesis polyprenyl glycosylphosphotransferase
MDDTIFVLPLSPGGARRDLDDLATPVQATKPTSRFAGEAEHLADHLARFFGRRIRPFVCASALLISDLLLAGGVGSLVCLAGAPSAAHLTARISPDLVLILVFAPIATVFSLWREGAYALDGTVPRLFAVALGWLNSSGLLLLGVYALDVIGTYTALQRDGIPGPVSVIAFVVAGGTAVLARNALWLALRPRVMRQLAREPAVVAGAGAFAFAETLQRKSETTEVVAVVSDLDGGADEVVGLVRAGVARTVFIVPSTDDGYTVGPLLAKIAGFPVAVRLVLDIAAIPVTPRGISLNAGLPVLHVCDPPLSRAAALLKRAEDIVLSSLLLLAAASIMLLASIAIKLESHGPVLFRQPRRGLNGSVIQAFKFRTMYAHFEDCLGSRQTMRGDPRVTRVGRLLRRHSLDELPQLFNVLAGTMSLVGPRAHPLGMRTAGGENLELAVTDYMSRHRIKPGITGWAQVRGCRGNLDTLEKAVRRVEHDLYYIENWSLLFDLRIIARTIALVVHDDHAF